MASSRASFVCVRQKAVLFDSVTSYQSSSFAQPGEIFLTDSSRARVVDGFHMVPVDCGAVEAAFLRLASSTDLQLNPDLVVLGFVFPMQSPPKDFQAVQVRQRAGLHSLEFLLACAFVFQSSSWQSRSQNTTHHAIFWKPPSSNQPSPKVSPVVRVVADISFSAGVPTQSDCSCFFVDFSCLHHLPDVLRSNNVSVCPWMASSAAREWRFSVLLVDLPR